MYIDILYDKDASKLAGTPIFACEEFIITRKIIIDFKRLGGLRLVDETTLPDEIACQAIVQFATPTTLKCVFFNPEFTIPPECYEEPLLNKQLIEWSAQHGGFRLEVVIPVNNHYIKLSIEESS